MDRMIKMNSYGKEETATLKKNLEDQLERLVQQLKDLDGCRSELEPVDYDETKRDTIDQMEELYERLRRISSGDMTLVDEISALKLSIRAAIRNSFEAPAMVEMLGGGKTTQLREALASIKRNVIQGKISQEVSERKSHEILTALKHRGEHLSPQEMELLNSLSYRTVDCTQFVRVSDSVNQAHDAIAIASEELETNLDF